MLPQQSYDEFYKENGFFVFRGVLSRERIQQVWAMLERDIFPSDGQFLRHPTGQYEAHRFLIVADGSNRRIVCNSLLNPHLAPETQVLGPELLGLLCTDGVADLLSTLDGEQSYTIRQIILFFVPPLTDVHIDGWGLDTHPRGGLHTVWVPLEPVRLKNGALAIIPWPRGRFLSPEELGIPDFASDENDLWGETYQRYHDALNGYIRDRHLPCIVPQLDPGDMVVFSSSTPHGTMPFMANLPSRLAMQVLVTPSRLPFGDVLSAQQGRHRTEEGTAVSRRWRV
jgi:ectoine hydroxylase-related dioxygenase (phytanoyl-CoA dioxygenase family)